MSESLNPLMGPPQAYVSHPGHGSAGPVIGVLAAIAVLGAIAVVIGRLCSGRRVMGQVGYDVEGWVETKCASCIDGRVDPTPPRGNVERPPCGGGGGRAPRGGGTVERENSRGSSCGGEESMGESGRPAQHDPCENV